MTPNKLNEGMDGNTSLSKKFQRFSWRAMWAALDKEAEARGVTIYEQIARRMYESDTVLIKVVERLMPNETVNMDALGFASLETAQEQVDKMDELSSPSAEEHT